jgi:hypothetical protein
MILKTTVDAAYLVLPKARAVHPPTTTSAGRQRPSQWIYRRTLQEIKTSLSASEAETGVSIKIVGRPAHLAMLEELGLDNPMQDRLSKPTTEPPTASSIQKCDKSSPNPDMRCTGG